MTDNDTNTELKRVASSITTGRIEALTDGVFAIVMTILVFDIHVPTQDVVKQLGLLLALEQLGGNLLGYVITFVIIGVLWVGHHNQFFYIRRADRTLLWINIVFYMIVALLPFSAGVFSRYAQDRVAIAVYDVNLILAELLLFAHWAYATRDSHLLNHSIEPHVRSIVNRRILTPPLFYLAAVLLAFISVDLSIAINILMPIVWAFPSRIDHIFHRG